MHLRSLRFVALLLPALLLGAVAPGTARAQQDNELARWLIEGTRLYRLGKFAEALPRAEQSVARARARHGDNSMELATAMAGPWS